MRYVLKTANKYLLTGLTDGGIKLTPLQSAALRFSNAAEVRDRIRRHFAYFNLDLTRPVRLRRKRRPTPRERKP